MAIKKALHQWLCVLAVVLLLADVTINTVAAKGKKDDEDSCPSVFVADTFSEVSYDNNDGSGAVWKTNWVENDPYGGGPDSGSISIFYDALYLSDESGSHPYIYRDVDLTGAVTALAKINYKMLGELNWIGGERRLVCAITQRLALGGSSEWRSFETWDDVRERVGVRKNTEETKEHRQTRTWVKEGRVERRLLKETKRDTGFNKLR